MTLTHWQVRRNQDVLGVFSTYQAAHGYAKDKAENQFHAKYVVGHIDASVHPADRRFVPSGYWQNGIWYGGEH